MMFYGAQSDRQYVFGADGRCRTGIFEPKSDTGRWRAIIHPVDRNETRCQGNICLLTLGGLIRVYVI